MKTMKNFLSMAALALMGAMMTGCSSDDNFDNPQQPENKSRVVTLTTTVGFDASAGTRALTIDGTKGVKTFAENDQIAVVYKKKTGGATAVAVSEKLTPADIASGSKSATFTVTLDDPDKDQEVTYIYPAAMAGETGVDLTKLNTQEGTFDALQSKYDLCTKSGAWDAGNLPSLTLENQLAILAITLKNDAATPAEITSSITSLTIGDGTNTYTVSRSAAAGPIYVAIRPVTSANISIEAISSSQGYCKTLATKTYAANNGFPVSWKMTPATLLSTIASDYTAQDGETLYGKLGSNVKISIADGAKVTLKDVTINGTNNINYEWAGITSGDNSIIILEGENTVKGFYEDYPGIYVPSGKTLTIMGSGSLDASSNGYAAGIGGARAVACGNITISGGNITATGGSNAGAGIGGSDYGICGTITISGGTVTATGGGGGAGIGGGFQGTFGAITISGGTVNATGGQYGAGIGGGNLNGTCGNITITSGVTSVIATKGDSAPNSIGKGDVGQDITVTIEAGANVIEN